MGGATVKSARVEGASTTGGGKGQCQRAEEVERYEGDINSRFVKFR